MSKSGIVLSNIDNAVRPQDDLFRHVNGRWLSGTVIPDDRPLEGSFTMLRDEAELAVRRIIEEAADAGRGRDDSRATAAGGADSGASAADLQRKIGNLYASFMNEEQIEAAGAAPVAGLIERIYATQSRTGFAELMGELGRHGIGGLFQFYINNDAADPTRYIFHLYQGGLGLPDESYYREDAFSGTRKEYLLHAERFLHLAGVADCTSAAAQVLELETRLAGYHLDSVSCRNPQLTHNLTGRTALAGMIPEVEPWFTGLGVPASKRAEVDVAQPEFLRGAGALLAGLPLEQWQHWLVLQLLHSSAPYLDSDFVAENFAFYGTTLSGTPRIRDRWKRGVALVEGALGEAIGRLYVQRNFPPAHKARMEELVANLLEAYRQSIAALTWMSPETIERALEKLTKFGTKIGYPDKWIDYSALEISPDDVYANVRRAESFELDRQLAKIGSPIDRAEWLITPQTVNAYYNPAMNEIVFPAAILQPPFFDADADPAANYGGIGAVIGHEIGHGFDDQGSQFDGDGALRNWWTDIDRDAFEALTRRLIGQYDALAPTEAPEHSVNGALTLGENIGDLGGLTIGALAYRLSLRSAEPAVIDGLTGQQRFFYAWAACWRQVIRGEEAVRRVTVDPHSPNEFRCNAVVRNMADFHAAFNLRPGDRLWLAPEDRVRIW